METDNDLLWNVIFGVLASICFVIGTTGNTLTLVYFLSRRTKSINTLLYISINSTDVLISILIMCVGISHFNSNTPTLFSDNVFCNIWGILWNIAARMSVFLIAVLSISRTISLIYPLRMHNMKHRTILVPVAMYFIIQVIQATIPYWYGVQYQYSGYLTFCSWGLDDVVGWNTVAHKILVFILIDLEFIAPLIPITGSCIICVYRLMKYEDSEIASQPGMGEIRRNATLTITLLTILYIVFNVPMCFYLIVFSVGVYDYTFQLPATLSIKTLNYLTIFAYIYTIALNSTCNTILYFTRIKEIREYVLRLIFPARWCKQPNDTANTELRTGYILMDREPLETETQM